MKNKKIFTIGIVCLTIFIIIASYLWYLYFNEYEGHLLSQNENTVFLRGVELVNSGSIDYINALPGDSPSIIPTYYFRVKNNSNKNYDYVLHIENASASDGCTPDTTFSRDELEYELKLDNIVIKSGNLSSIRNNILDVNTISQNSVKDYSLRIWLKDGLVDYEKKHFHYVVNIKEKK